MFSHTSPPNPAPEPTSVRKHCFFCFFCSFHWFVWFFFGFYLFFNGSGSFLIVFICFSMAFFGFTLVLNSFWWFLLVFHMVLLCFGWSPLVFHCFWGFCIGFKRKPMKTIRKPIPADSGTSPELPSEPLPPLSQPAPGLLLRDFPWVSPCRLASSGLLWLALAPSFLSLSPVTRNKEEIRLWGLSGASVWDPPPLSLWVSCYA